MSSRFQETPILEVNGDAGDAEAVVANATFGVGDFGAVLDDKEGVHATHALVGQFIGTATSRPKEGSFGVLLQAGCRDVGVQVLLGLVMTGDFMELSAFLVEPQPAAFSLG